jgi:hypothetical protein
VAGEGSFEPTELVSDVADDTSETANKPGRSG